jgi:hypothetical protein
MTDILNPDLVQRLIDIAHQQQRSPDEIFEQMLERYEAQISDYPPDSFARLAAGGRNMSPTGQTGDVAENADEILRQKYAKHLLKKMQAL